MRRGSVRKREEGETREAVRMGRDWMVEMLVERVRKKEAKGGAFKIHHPVGLAICLSRDWPLECFS